MIRTQESTGKTVDEARAKACAMLGVQADDLNVSYEVLEMPQKTGFLGLKTTPAKVRALVCVGGTARAALKLAKRVCHLPEDTNRVSVGQLEQVSALLCSSHKAAADLILKVEPERIHTMIPGLLILRHMVEGFGAGEMIVSKYGVREGYLCQKIRKAS